MGGRHLFTPIYHTRGRAQTIAVLFLGQAPLRCVIGNGTALTTAEARIQPTSGRNALARTSTALAYGREADLHPSWRKRSAAGSGSRAAEAFPTANMSAG